MQCRTPDSVTAMCSLQMTYEWGGKLGLATKTSSRPAEDMPPPRRPLPALSRPGTQLGTRTVLIMPSTPGPATGMPVPSPITTVAIPCSESVRSDRGRAARQRKEDYINGLTNYVDFDPARTPKPGASGACEWKGIPVMCGPRGLPRASNALYRNLGDGRFDDVSEPAGIPAPGGRYALGAVAADP